MAGVIWVSMTWRACSVRVGARPAGAGPGATIRTVVMPGTAARIWASMREASGTTAPGDPVSSKVAIPSWTPATRTAAPRAMIECSRLFSREAATCTDWVAATGGPGTSRDADRYVTLG